MQINGKQAVLQKMVYELRYRRGYVYLDKCGRTLDALVSRYPEWAPRDDAVSPQNAPLVSFRNRAVLNFSSKKIDLSLEMSSGGNALSDQDVDAFAAQGEAVTNLIIEQLGLKDFERIGFRAWYLFPCDHLKEATSWLTGLKFFNLSERSRAAFPGELESVSLAAVFQGETNYRIALNQVERTTQVDVGQEILNVRASKLHKKQREFFHEQLKVRKRLQENPAFAAMVDIDAFRNDPETVAPQEFIKHCMSEFATRIAKIPE